MAQATMLDVCQNADVFCVLAEFLVETDIVSDAGHCARLRWFDEISWICKAWLAAWKILGLQP